MCCDLILLYLTNTYAHILSFLASKLWCRSRTRLYIDSLPLFEHVRFFDREIMSFLYM